MTEFQHDGPVQGPPTLRDELRNLLNRHSIDTKASTPDFILAEMLVGHLEVYIDTLRQARQWHGWPTLEQRLLGRASGVAGEDVE